jgi:hypothetical protein
VPSPSGGRAEAAGEGDARQWLIDNDLWDDGVGMLPEQYHRMPTSTGRTQRTLDEVRPSKRPQQVKSRGVVYGVVV